MDFALAVRSNGGVDTDALGVRVDRRDELFVQLLAANRALVGYKVAVNAILVIPILIVDLPGMLALRHFRPVGLQGDILGDRCCEVELVFAVVPTVEGIAILRGLLGLIDGFSFNNLYLGSFGVIVRIEGHHMSDILPCRNEVGIRLDFGHAKLEEVAFLTVDEPVGLLAVVVLGVGLDFGVNGLAVHNHDIALERDRANLEVHDEHLLPVEVVDDIAGNFRDVLIPFVTRIKLVADVADGLLVGGRNRSSGNLAVLNDIALEDRGAIKPHNIERVGLPRSLEGHILSRHGSGNRDFCAAGIDPTDKGVVILGRVGRSRNGGAVILGNGRDLRAAVGVEGQGELIDRPLSVQGESGLGADVADRLLVGEGLAAAIGLGIPAIELVAGHFEGVLAQLGSFSRIFEVLRIHLALAAIGVKGDNGSDRLPLSEEINDSVLFSTQVLDVSLVSILRASAVRLRVPAIEGVTSQRVSIGCQFLRRTERHGFIVHRAGSVLIVCIELDGVTVGGPLCVEGYLSTIHRAQVLDTRAIGVAISLTFCIGVPTVKFVTGELEGIRGKRGSLVIGHRLVGHFAGRLGVVAVELHRVAVSAPLCVELDVSACFCGEVADRLFIGVSGSLAIGHGVPASERVTVTLNGVLLRFLAVP